jgi:hypothetical protein
MWRGFSARSKTGGAPACHQPNMDDERPETDHYSMTGADAYSGKGLSESADMPRTRTPRAITRAGAHLIVRSMNCLERRAHGPSSAQGGLGCECLLECLGRHRAQTEDSLAASRSFRFLDNLGTVSSASEWRQGGVIGVNTGDHRIVARARDQGPRRRSTASTTLAGSSLLPLPG